MSAATPVILGFQVYRLEPKGDKDKWEKAGRMYLVQEAAEQLAALIRQGGVMAEVRSVNGIDHAF